MKIETYDMKQTADLINIGKLKLFKILREKNILTVENLPYIKYRELGYFKIYTSTYVHDIRGLMARSKTVVTEKGIAFITELVNDYLNEAADDYPIQNKLSASK